MSADSALLLQTPGPAMAADHALSVEQIAVVTACTQHLIIEADAGSGKTTVLIDKMLFEMDFLAIEGQRPPRRLTMDQIGAITFTRKAAGELTDRLRQALLQRAAESEGTARERWAEQAFRVDQAAIGTIDAFAGRLLREFGGLANLETGFRVLDPSDAQALYREVAEQSLLAGVQAGDEGARLLVTQFGYLRSRDILVEWMEQAPLLDEVLRKVEEGRWSWAATDVFLPTSADAILEPVALHLLTFARTVRRALRDRLTTDGTWDHNHVLLAACDMLTHASVQQAVRGRFKVVFVDEHQDTNLAQCRLFFRLAGLLDNCAVAAVPVDVAADPTQTDVPMMPRLRLVLIGDPKQGIYGFRQADITMWRRSRDLLLQHGGQAFALTVNHRSAPALTQFFDDCLGPVLEARDLPAGTRYEVNYQSMVPQRPAMKTAGVEVCLAENKDIATTAAMVAERIQAMLATPERYPVAVRAADGSWTTRPLRPRDIAVLARQLQHSADAYEQALRDRGIGAYVYGGRGLFARDEVRDVATLLSVVVDPDEPFALTALLRSPLGGVDDATLLVLAQASVAAAADAPRQTLYAALQRADVLVPTTEGRAACARVVAVLDELRALRDRLPHDQLLERAFESTGYRAFLAGAPDAPAGTRNLAKLLQIARQFRTEPLGQFVDRLSARVRRGDVEDEAPLYAPDDDLVVISTIHKAKGLEWPVVILADIDTPVARKAMPDLPALDAVAGLALPLEVFVRHGIATRPLGEASAVWTRYVGQAFAREYAEAKRVFYVACTRARDRLIFVGALDRPKMGSAVPRQCAQTVQDVVIHGVERWLRWRYPVITKTGTGAPRSFAYGPTASPCQGQIRRGLPEMRDRATPATHTAPVQKWPAIAAPTVPGIQQAAEAVCTPAVTNALASQIGPLLHRAGIKNEFSASELLVYRTCATKHLYHYVASLSAPELIASTTDATVNRLAPAVRGSILHDFLARVQGLWTAEARNQAMQQAVLRHVQLPDDVLAETVTTLLRHADGFLASSWGQRVAAARAEYREAPFVWAPETTLLPYRLVGNFDLLFQESDGWRIVDFKTANFRAYDDPAEMVAIQAARYELQAAVYCLSAQAALAQPIKEFVFFFTDVGLTYTITVTPAWLAAWQVEIERAVQGIRTQAYPAPVWVKARCHGCVLLPLCRPEGVPLEDILLPQGLDCPALPSVGGDLELSDRDLQRALPESVDSLR